MSVDPCSPKGMVRSSQTATGFRLPHRTDRRAFVTTVPPVRPGASRAIGGGCSPDEERDSAKSVGNTCRKSCDNSG
ncbi:hypothetical protein JW905_18890, partial [bacterium]|nr:hypothetical protein [candidate division CSSED10-310 bacterium]